ncbi:hypothetical protein SAMN05720606_10818 [Paenibacillus polysaccharolyticus]|uniref:Uncharacterized protein n=2 Tax=Paenibacillus TaxID=44249 RepID=A0A1G5I4U1_9BACL|nr:hypothetical protein SAMN05720606_10818 [Paenibacillus polysaccharolyticus]
MNEWFGDHAKMCYYFYNSIFTEGGKPKMRQHPRLLHHMIIIILCVFQALCFPIPMQTESAVGVSVDATSNKEGLEVLSQIPESQQKPVIRKNPQVMSKLAAVKQTKPVFLVLALLIVLRIPTAGLSFKPWYCLFKRRLFLLPIKYTSMYLSLSPMAPRYA